jgi:hypothetical protein
MWDNKRGWCVLFFDDVTEAEATEIIVRNLINGIPDETVVSKIPEFLAREMVTG